MRLSDYTTYYHKDGTTSLGFTKRGCGTSTHYEQISKEEYEKYSAMSRGELNKLVERGLSDAARWGYGYYGSSLYHDGENDLYFLGTCLGNSCD